MDGETPRGRPGGKLLDQTRLADSGLPADKNGLALALFKTVVQESVELT